MNENLRIDYTIECENYILVTALRMSETLKDENLIETENLHILIEKYLNESLMVDHTMKI